MTDHGPTRRIDVTITTNTSSLARALAEPGRWIAVLVVTPGMRRMRRHFAALDADGDA